MAPLNWKGKAANFGLQLGREQRHWFMHLWWVIRLSLGLPAFHQGDSLSVLMNPIISFNHRGVGSTPPRWQPCRRAALMNQLADPSKRAASTRLPLSACKPLCCPLALIAEAHMNHWCAQLILSASVSGREQEQQRHCPHLSLFCVRSDVSHDWWNRLGWRKNDPRRGPC